MGQDVKVHFSVVSNLGPGPKAAYSRHYIATPSEKTF